MPGRTTPRRRALALSAAVAAVVAGGRAQAVNLIMNFNSGASQNPTSDPAGTNLINMMSYIEGYYEDIFQDAHTLTVNFWWDDLGGTTVGSHLAVTNSGGRQIECNVRLDTKLSDGTQRLWYFDQTPENHSEYDMQQTLWRDMSAGTQSARFNAGANIPATFEAGFTGLPASGAPANAINGYDLLTSAIHEVGHGLGCNTSPDTTAEVGGDNDYDFDSVNVFGKTLAAICDTGPDIAHLAGTDALMAGGVAQAGRRRMPSHTDLFAMAKANGFSSLDIPRREFYGGGDWNTAADWSGNAVPGSADEVFVRASGPADEARTATLSAAGFADTLHVSEASNVVTGALKLDVTGTATIDGLNTDIFVDIGGELEADSVVVQNSAQLSFRGGLVDVNTITNTAEIHSESGSGTLNVQTSLLNNGEIRVSDGTLTIRSANPSVILNLDGFAFPGTEAGVITLDGGNLTVKEPLADDFNGTIAISPSCTLTMEQAWTLANVGSFVGSTDGVLNLNGGTTSATAAVVAGAAMDVGGDINVNASKYGRITAPVNMLSAATIVANGTLEFDGDLTYAGGSHTGSGRMIWDGNVTVTADTTIAVADLDLDGFTPLATLTINNSAALTINSQITDSPSGTIDVRGSMLVNGGAWTNAGTLLLDTGTLGGSSSFTNSGTLSVLTGISSITTGSTFSSSSQNVLTGTLRLLGDATIAGGSWTGLGTLSLANQTTTFTANTTLAMANFNMDGPGAENGTININSGVILTSNSTLTDAFDATLNLNGGTFNQTIAWTNSGTINLNGSNSRVAGAVLTNDAGGLISGNGSMISADLVNDGTLTASGGTLTLSTTSFPDLDGTGTEDGTINALAGNIRITSNFGTLFTFDGDLNIGAGRAFVMDLHGLVINSTNSGRIDFTGGSYQAPGFELRGILTVNTAGSSLNAGTYLFSSPSSSTLNANLTLDGIGTIETGAQFFGAGDLIVPVTRLLNFTGADVDVDLQNNGTLQVLSGANHVMSIVGTGTTLVQSGASLDVGSNGPVTQAQFSVAGNADVGNVNTTLQTRVFAGGTLTANYVRGGELQVAGGMNMKSNGTTTATSNVTALSIAGGITPTGKVDLNNNDMVIDYSGASPLLTIAAQLRAGYSLGAWTGNGIASSAAASAGNTALGYAENATLGLSTFSGQTVDATSILIRYTYSGDADLNNFVDTLDFNLLAGNFGGSGKSWTQGNFNYDLVTDSTDFNLLVSNFGRRMPGAAPALGAVVPEPSAVAAILITAAATRRRRWSAA